MRATAQKRKAEKTEAKLGEYLKKKLKSKSMLGSNIINIQRKIIYECNIYIVDKEDGEAQIESDMIATQYQAL